MRFVIITGLSGAGKSHAIKSMEDLGYYCIDNMPPALITKFAKICFQSHGKIEKVALVTDIRGGELFNDIFNELDALKGAGYAYEILFLEASDDVLIKRYKESRRRHPLSQEGRIVESIKDERILLQDVRKIANNIIDTSNLLPRELKYQISTIFGHDKKYKGVIITILSFGFKYGIPLDADLVFDVRFIPNPFYIEELKQKTGENKDVEKYVFKWPQTQEFLDKLSDMLTFLIPHYIEEGKSQLVVSIGCTGGKHRSVAIARVIHERLTKANHRTIIEHRDIEKDNRGGR